MSPTMRFGDLDRQPETLEPVPTAVTARVADCCPACGMDSANFSTVPHEEYQGKERVTVSHRVCLGCRHLID